MTTIRQIIIDAFRESGIIEVGTVPEAEEYSEAFDRLEVIVKSLVGNELGDKLTAINFGDYLLDSEYAKLLDESSAINAVFIPANCRLIFNNGEEVELDLPPNPSDGNRVAVVDNADNFATYNVILKGNGRKIESAADITLSTDGLTREWFYRADTGNWVRLTDLESDDESPFPQEFDDLLILLLAMRINPRFGASTAAETVEAVRRSKVQFRSRYRQVVEQDVEDGLAVIGHRGSSKNKQVSFDLGI